MAVQNVTARMVRVTLGGDELHGFVSSGFDDHVKLFFPYPGEVRPILPAAQESDQVTTENALKPIARDFTPRRYDAAGSAGPLLGAVRALTLPSEDVFTWVACESAVAKALRLHCLNERGFSKDRVKTAGYWKRGAVAVHDKHAD